MLAFLAVLALTADPIQIVDVPPSGGRNPYYLGNRAPLTPTPFRKLPIGAIKPRGWIKKQLDLEAAGFVGHLEEISPWLKRKNNAWLSPTGEGEHGWEEVPYWLKGFGDLGYVLDDGRIIADARFWIRHVLDGQAEDGWLGPRSNRVSNKGKPDMWPNMPMLDALQSYYEYLTWLHPSSRARDGAMASSPAISGLPSTNERQLSGPAESPHPPAPSPISRDMTEKRLQGPRHEEIGEGELILQAMRKYFQWQLALPEEDFYLSYWEKQRGGDNLAGVYWLYNRTGEPWLLDLARKIHRRTAPWADGVPDWHGVNFAQAFREPAEASLLDTDPSLVAATESDYQRMRTTYGQVPGGMYGADENARPGFTDPRQAAETCAMVEMMHSTEMLLTLFGDRKWAERCEDVAFNSLPASMTADEKALHYLTAPNMPLCDAQSKAPGLQNSGPMLLFNPYDHRCCQHNVAQGWPYYAESLWFATDHNGLGAALYGPCEVTAKAGNGTPVTIRESTNYPFGETIEFRLNMKRGNRFPLTLRLPTWSDTPTLTLNGKRLSLPATRKRDGGYVIVTRSWRDGDRLTLHVPMHLELVKWKKNHNAISVNRGPLSYSLQIGEQLVRQGGTDRWPAWELRPTTPWNFGLVLDLRQFKVHVSGMPEQPFSPDATPVHITAPARRIASWALDIHGLLEPLQDSPVLTYKPVETVNLIPMGAARLRLSAFPSVTDQMGHLWKPAIRPKKALPAVASTLWPADTLDALSDGLLPRDSGDESIPRFTWWDHKGGSEWVEYRLPSAISASQAQVYWFDDRASKGGCRVPESWRLLAWEGSRWVPVRTSGPYGVERDRFNSIRFEPVSSERFRIEAKLRPGTSSGILEWILK